MARRKLLSALLAVAAVQVSAAPGKAAGRPNVLLIMADDVGVETLGCYGGQSHQTPHINALAEGGMRFEHCYSMPVCHPTRVTLLTGKYPFRLGRPGWGTFPAGHEKRTLAHAMKDAGYSTAIAGKWQLALLKRDPQHPHRLGFDTWCLFGWHEGPRYYQPLIWQDGSIRDDVADRYGPDVYVEFLTGFMKANRDKPFFAFYSMALCHDVTDDLKEPVPFGPAGHYDTYAQMVAQMDRHVGMIVAALDRLGLREETLILFTADNGTSKSYIHTARDGKYIRRPVYSTIGGRQVRGGKGELTDGGTNVPLIANWKGVVKPRQVIDDLVDMSDFLPTLVELAGGTLPEDLQTDGRSFAGRLRTNKPSPRPWAYSERGNRHWLRTQRYKLYDDGRFFDMQTDPREKHPLEPAKLPADAADTYRSLQEALSSLRR